MLGSVLSFGLTDINDEFPEIPNIEVVNFPVNVGTSILEVILLR